MNSDFLKEQFAENMFSAALPSSKVTDLVFGSIIKYVKSYWEKTKFSKRMQKNGEIVLQHLSTELFTSSQMIAFCNAYTVATEDFSKQFHGTSGELPWVAGILESTLQYVFLWSEDICLQNQWAKIMQAAYGEVDYQSLKKFEKNLMNSLAEQNILIPFFQKRNALNKIEQKIDHIIEQWSLQEDHNSKLIELTEALFPITVYWITMEELVRIEAENDNTLKSNFYRITDDFYLLMKAVILNWDEPNNEAIQHCYRVLKTKKNLFIMGAGGTGKTTLAMRLAVELTWQGKQVFWLKPLIGSKVTDVQIKTVLNYITKNCINPILIFDNPCLDPELTKRIQILTSHYYKLQVILVERINRMVSLMDISSVEYWMADAEAIYIGPKINGISELFSPMAIISIDVKKDWKYTVLKKVSDVIGNERGKNVKLMQQALNKVNNSMEITDNNIVELIYYLFISYNELVRNSETSEVRLPENSPIPLDWDEWETTMLEWRSELVPWKDAFGYLAAFYLFALPLSLESFCAKYKELDLAPFRAFAQKRLTNKMEPVRYEQGHFYLRHDMVAEIYFKYVYFKYSVKVVEEYLSQFAFFLSVDDCEQVCRKIFQKANLIRKSVLPLNMNLDSTLAHYTSNETFLDRIPLSCRPFLDMAQIWSKIGQKADNILLCKKAEKLLGDYSNLPCSILNEIGIIFTNGKSYQKAEETFRKALEIDPNHIPALNELGRLYANSRRAEEAEETFRKALEIDPNHIPALNELGRLYANSRRAEEAEETFRKALEIDPNHIPALNELGRLYANSGRAEEAEETFRKALEIDPNNIPALNELGRLYANSGRAEKAEETFRKALEIDPNNIPALNELGRLLKVTKPKQALFLFEHICNISPTDIIARYELARLYKRIGNINRAQELFEQILINNPYDSQALIGLFYLYFDNTDYVDAAKLLKKYQGKHTNNKYYYRCCEKLARVTGDDNTLNKIQGKLKSLE